MDKFRKLGIPEPVLKAIAEMGFTEPSDIQEKAIPLAMAGKDVIGEAATGSGKTLAFGASIINNTESGKGIQALVLTPTRELAEQVSKALGSFSKYKQLHVVPIYGGVSINPQMEHLKIADVVVGTPGRILDHMQRRSIDLRHIKTFVLDEADRMVDMGFIDDVKRILSGCPRQKQTLLFSATITPEIDHIKHKFMNNPEKASVDNVVDPTKLKQIYYDVESNLKLSLLVHLLKHEKSGLVMVFCNSRTTTDFVTRNLNAAGIQSMAIHGGFSQQSRSNVMDKFHSNQVYVLVCTDLAARGLDVKGVSHVYNFDIPKESKQYVHRIGRTARAGEEGIAINLLCRDDHDNFRRIMRDTTVQIEKIETPFIERVKMAHLAIGQDDGLGERVPTRNSGRRPPQHGGHGGGHSGGHSRSSYRRR